MAETDSDWMTVERIYEYLGKQVPLDTIRSWIRKKKLQAYRPGRVYLVKREDLEEFLQRSQTDKDS